MVSHYMRLILAEIKKKVASTMKVEQQNFRQGRSKTDLIFTVWNNIKEMGIQKGYINSIS